MSDADELRKLKEFNELHLAAASRMADLIVWLKRALLSAGRKRWTADGGVAVCWCHDPVRGVCGDEPRCREARDAVRAATPPKNPPH